MGVRKQAQSPVHALKAQCPAVVSKQRAHSPTEPAKRRPTTPQFPENTISGSPVLRLTKIQPVLLIQNGPFSDCLLSAFLACGSIRQASHHPPRPVTASLLSIASVFFLSQCQARCSPDCAPSNARSTQGASPAFPPRSPYGQLGSAGTRKTSSQPSMSRSRPAPNEKATLLHVKGPDRNSQSECLRLVSISGTAFRTLRQDPDPSRCALAATVAARATLARAASSALARIS